MTVQRGLDTAPGTTPVVPAFCPACGAAFSAPFLDLGAVPVFCNALFPTAQEAREAPLGEVRLAFCQECGLVANVAFFPDLVAYSPAYENSLHFSPLFRRYADSLITDLSTRYDLTGKKIVEIGAGKGDFLRLLCARTSAQGLGFDPSYAPVPGVPSAEVGEGRDGRQTSVRFLREFYSPLHAKGADLIVCRHVLEHLPAPFAFLQSVRAAIADRHDTRLYFEVPNLRFTLAGGGIWDVIYEHCLYFAAEALACLFEKAGFRVLDLAPAFGGQYLGVHAAPLPGGEQAGVVDGDRQDTAARVGVADLSELTGLVHAFAEAHRVAITESATQLDVALAAGPVAVWGAGSKGVMFLNLLPRCREVTCAVDLNPGKQEKFVPGTAHRVIAPETLSSLSPESLPATILVMNPLYEEEICAHIAGLGLRVSVRSV